MLKPYYTLFLLLLLSSFPVFADEPQFPDYPATKANQKSDLNSIQEAHLKERSPELQEALKTQKFNYAGHYIIYTKSCGENCIAILIADTKTEQNIMTSFNEYYIYDKNNIPFEMSYKPNSNLLIISGTSKYLWKYPTQTYWVLDQGKIHKLTGYYDFHKIEHNKVNFQKHCQDLNIGKKFNVTSDFLCVYPNKTIKDIYNKLLNSSDDRRFLNYPPPKIGKNKEYTFKNDGDAAGIAYEWLSRHCLKITIYQSSVGETTYIITQENNKVKVRIHMEKNKNHQVTIEISP